MSENFLNGLANETNKTRTTNGAEAFKSTKSDLLDFFSVAGAMRETDENTITRKFRLAYQENPLLAMKALFLTRNVRGGLGERRVPKLIVQDMVKYQPESIKKNLGIMAQFGRWDDILWLLDTELESQVIEIIKSQLAEDMQGVLNGEAISSLAKWLPSINTSSKETRKKGRKVATALGLTEKLYRKTLSKMRKYLDVVEVKMASNKWDEIKYSAVTSKAMKNYNRAFAKHDETGFAEYLVSLEKGETKINSTTLYPYELVSQVIGLGQKGMESVVNAQWEALPNYVEGEHNVLVMADVSGSMNGMPLNSSIGLAMYCAERNSGAFKNKFMTFSTNPQLVSLKGSTFAERAKNLSQASWDMSTDFQKALGTILDTAVNNNLEQGELPEKLIVVSDMQFNDARGNGYSWRRQENTSENWGFYGKMKQMYKDKGYNIPQIVFWNVNSPKDSYMVDCDCEGVGLVSGQSPSMFKYVLTGDVTTPYEMMVDALNDPIYDCVKA